MKLSRSSAGRVLIAGLLLVAGACSGATPGPAPAPTPGRSSTAGGTGTSVGTGATGSIPSIATTWPSRTREHLDVWLHSYAMLTSDTTLVPYFKRGYRERMTDVRRQRNVSTLLDANRTSLLARMNVNPALATSGQFIPLYFESWDQMRQAIDVFIRANGNPNATNDPNLRMYLALLSGTFQTAADREWLRQFAESVDDESRRFYHEYWTGEVRTRAAVVASADSLWQRQWRTALQRFLNNTQQQSGELYLSMPLGGEGRTVHFGKQQNAVGVPLPDATADAAQVLYVMVHEIAGGVASAAIEDNTTPADRREGVTSKYEQSAAVRAGALLLERTIPSAVPGYMRYYLQAAGKTAPTDPRASFASVFAVPASVLEALGRQFGVILGGI